ADIAIENGYVSARASRLKAARITTDLVTVTGTENLMMAAVLAEGTTVIENAAREPEVVDLATLLTAMGARIQGAGTARIEIEGVVELGGAVHRVVPDRVEAGTLIVAALARMGARIETEGAIAIVRGVPGYQGAPVMASDLRASAALVLAGLAARGTTIVARVYHLDRGYERLEVKLGALGARIVRRA